MYPGPGDDEDLIGVGPDDEPGPPWWTTRRRRAAAGIALAVMAVVTGAGVITGTRGHPRGPARPAPAAAVPRPVAVPAVKTLPGGILPGEHGNWELDALSTSSAGAALVRIQFGPGKVTWTPLPPLGSAKTTRIIVGLGLGSADLIDPGGDWPPPGVISPDGRLDAVLGDIPGRGAVLRLVDLRTGAERLIISGYGAPGWQGLSWSPDSRWLFAGTSDGTLEAIDRKTGWGRGLGVAVTGVRALTVRGLGSD